MIIVHHLEHSRSQRVLWLLEELGLDYEVRRHARDPRTMLAPPALRAVHPLGKSPVVDAGDIRVAETGAIFEHLLETHDGAGQLSPARGTPERRALTYWLHYAEGSAMPPLLMKLVFQRLPENAPFLVRPFVGFVSKRAETGFVDPQLKTHIDYWDNTLADTGWFAGADFSAGDIMMSFPLEAAASRMDLSGHGNIKAFLDRIHARAAYQKALERGGPYAYA